MPPPTIRLHDDQTPMSQSLSERLHGIYPPVITPLTAERRFDSTSASRLYQHHLDAGVDGLFLFGSSGEGALLSEADRRDALQLAVELVGGRVPVLAAILEPGTDRVIEQARVAEELGADGLVICPPYYYPSSQADLIRHFEEIHQAVSVPLIAYDIPSTTKTKIDFTTMTRLAEAGLVIGAKDSSGDVVGFRRLLEKRPAGFRLFTGAEVLVDAALDFGADGTVSGLANVAPELFVELYAHWRAGNRDEARETQKRIVRLFDVFLSPDGSIDSGTAIGAMKTAMVARGLIDSDTLSRPFAPVTEKQAERTRRIMRECGLI